MTYLDDILLLLAVGWQDPHQVKRGLTEEQFLAEKLRSDEEKNNIIEKFIDSAIMQSRQSSGRKLWGNAW
ncbi:hypothetical protein midi_00171 [Candidatus Midichloria mitochondrii IricVA]|uniref:Uncharacterized protein n=2 Tax=Candidatus Midichloria mitochondrii TaxID=234827 RepID=F7XUZ2_MIDMI|nr:hypothetical protein midi_00171 [Candidatus Midichloria mitochondrii IricVA]